MFKIFLLSATIYLIPVSIWAQSVSKEVSILSDAGDNVGRCSLGATFLKPLGDAPKALVLFVHGSGTINRDGLTPFGNQPFKDIAEKFAREGFASLRFDKRGIQPECRTAIANNPSLSPMHYIQDIRNIVQFIRTEPEMKDLPLVLLGHSEGVNFVTEIAAKDTIKVKALILLAGLGKYSIDQTLLRQYQQSLGDPNLSHSDKMMIRRLIEDGRAFFQKIHGGFASASDNYMSVYSKYWIDWIDITRNAAHSARQVKVPSLVIRGTVDRNVTVEDFEALRSSTQEILGSDSFAPVGVDHYLAPQGSRTVAPAILDRIAAWLRYIP